MEAIESTKPIPTAGRHKRLRSSCSSGDGRKEDVTAFLLPPGACVLRTVHRRHWRFGLVAARERKRRWPAVAYRNLIAVIGHRAIAVLDYLIDIARRHGPQTVGMQIRRNP